ncbi:MAG: hypothetical protein K8R60_05335 [Burkholderiales bacterium]|nr:hypothetical protein [Burkholderiales bacterium]
MPIRSRAVLPTATFAALLTSLAVSAQLPPAPAATGAAPAPTYRSAFDGYRRYQDQPVGSWRQANERVGRIGGWQAYAREAQASGPAASAPAPGASDPHSAHRKP